jgi:hypothetical protein
MRRSNLIRIWRPESVPPKFAHFFREHPAADWLAFVPLERVREFPRRGVRFEYPEKKGTIFLGVDYPQN